jgi:hypothetical protein
MTPLYGRMRRGWPLRNVVPHHLKKTLKREHSIPPTDFAPAAKKKHIFTLSICRSLADKKVSILYKDRCLSVSFRHALRKYRQLGNILKKIQMVLCQSFLKVCRSFWYCRSFLLSVFLLSVFFGIVGLFYCRSFLVLWVFFVGLL